MRNHRAGASASPTSTSAVSFCSKKGTACAKALALTRQREAPAGLGATSLATVMQMVAKGHGVTLVPEVAVGVDTRDDRVKLMRFVEPEPARTIGLAWRRTCHEKTISWPLARLSARRLPAVHVEGPCARQNKKRRHCAALFRGCVARRYSAAPPCAAWGWSPPSARCLPSMSSPVA